MKIFVKGMLGTAVALFTIGAILAVAGWAMGAQTSMNVTVAGHEMTVGIHGISGWNGGQTKTQSENRVTKETVPAFDKLDVDISLGKVTVLASDHYGFDLSWRGKNYKLEYTLENGELKIWSTSIPNLGINLDFNYDADVTIYLPQDVKMSRVSLKDALGDIDVQGVHADTLDVKANMGSVTAKEITMTSGTWKLDMGDLEINTLTADTLDLTLAMGELTTDQLSTARSLTVSNHMGSIDLSGSFAGKTKVKANMGEINVSTDDSKRNYGYDLNCSMGEVEIDGVGMGDRAQRSDGTHSLEIEADLGNIYVNFNG